MANQWSSRQWKDGSKESSDNRGSELHEKLMDSVVNNAGRAESSTTLLTYSRPVVSAKVEK